MPDYIPPVEDEFDTWIQNLQSKLDTAPADYGLVAGDLVPLTGAVATWKTDLAAARVAEMALAAAMQSKQTSRATATGEARQLVARIQANNSVDDAARAAAGIPVRDTTKTPAAVPTSAPSATIDAGRRWQHTVHFRDDQTPNSKAKPAGVRGAEIWMKIGDPAPASQNELHFITLDSRTPHTINFESVDAGQTVHYWLRWVNTRNEPGPWGNPVSAMIMS